jgi:ferrochelatase
MANRKVGVLVMSYGTPESMDQVEAYYTHIRRGNPPSPEQLKDLVDRYEAIGGCFPLRSNTNDQLQKLENTLNESASDVEFVCYHGLKHESPFIEDGVKQIVEDGLQEAVGIVLAPHFSTMSVGSYIKRAKEAAEALGLEQISFVSSYHLHPKLIQALTERVASTLGEFKGVERDEVRVIFSAHSLPERILEMKDPYPDQLNETAKAIANQLGITNWQFAWQSAGQTNTPWLGPDILDVLETIGKEEQVKNVMICPIGFVSDHLEILYDIDIECQKQAKSLGMTLKRTASLNTDPLYMETLADEVMKQLDQRKDSNE